MYEWPVLTPGLSSEPSPLPNHLPTLLLYHLHGLLGNYTDHSLRRPCANPCSFPVNTGDQVLLSPSDQCPLPLSPKWQSLGKVILVTPTAAKLEGLLWIHLPHPKSFTPQPQDNLSSYTVAQTGLCSLEFQRTPKSTALSAVPEG